EGLTAMTWLLENLWLVPLLPFCTFWLILFFGKRLPKGGSELGIFALASCWVLAVLDCIALIRRPTTETGEEAVRHFVERNYTWFSNGQVKITVGFHADGLAVMMLFVVATISLLVHVYSTEYMRDDVRYTHFVTAASTVQGLFGWEMMGLCSFMLIGHWWEDKANSDAALKAFFTTRTGDVGLL